VARWAAKWEAETVISEVDQDEYAKDTGRNTAC